MRFNRGTAILVVAALVVIVAVLLLNNQAEAPAELTPTVTVGGALFEELAGNDIALLEVVNNQTGDSVLLTQDTGGAWAIAEATFAQALDADQSKAQGVVGNFVLLEADDTFESEALADFGLAAPTYVITADMRDGTRETLYVGSQNPTGNRYYVLRESGDTPAELSDEIAALEATEEATAEATVEAEATEAATAESTPEATEESADEAEPTAEATPEPYQGVTLAQTSGTVYTVQRATLDTLLNLITLPPYVPSPTPSPSPTVTLNPMSEVEQATATAQFYATATELFAQLETETAATAAAEVTAEATAEATEAPE